jgi:hypothetical protein
MNSELEQRLTALGAALEFPPAPDVAPAVLARLTTRPRWRLPARRTVAIVVAGTLLLAGAAMAAPPSRHAILDVVGLGGVKIERVPRLPPVPAGTGTGLRLGLGRAIPLAGARHAARFTALIPPGSPTAYLNHDVPGGRISLLSGRVLIIEFRGTATPFIFKVIGPGTSFKQLRVNGGPGVYLSGAPHEVLFQTATGQVRTDRVRLAGDVLVWQQGQLTIRIEGTRTLAQALALARSLR